MKYEEMPDLKDVVDKLKEAFPEKLSHIQSDRILYLCFSKRSSETKGRIGPIRSKYSVFFKKHEYLLEIHKESWLAYDIPRRLYVVLHELCHIPEGGFDDQSKEYKKVIKHDIQDFRELVRTYGVDLENVEKLAEKIS